jgi:hypothetical protein
MSGNWAKIVVFGPKSLSVAKNLSRLADFFSSKSMRPSGPYLAGRATDPLRNGHWPRVYLDEFLSGVTLSMVTLWSYWAAFLIPSSLQRTAGWPFLSITCTGNGHPAVLRLAGLRQISPWWPTIFHRGTQGMLNEYALQWLSEVSDLMLCSISKAIHLNQGFQVEGPKKQQTQLRSSK